MKMHAGLKYDFLLFNLRKPISTFKKIARGLSWNQIYDH
jgi:hypothetical protein